MLGRPVLWLSSRAREGKGERESIGSESSPGFDKGLPLQSCVALGMEPNLWETQFSHLKNKLDDRSVN